MATLSSFDINSTLDLQEVDNAINQAQKEVAQRYDFKGSKATIEFKKVEADVQGRMKTFLGIKGKRTVDSFHRELGKLCWDYCGMARNANGLKTAIQKIQGLREEFWKNLTVLGSNEELNTSLEKAGRVADFLEFGELMCLDALERDESCGGHFREEHATPEGEAKRDDDRFAHVAAWEYKGEGQKPVRNVEPLTFDYVHPTQRSYK